MSHANALSALTLMLALAAAPAFAEEQHHSTGTPPAAATAPQAMPGMGQGTPAGGTAGMGRGGMQGMPMMGMMREGGMQQGMPMMCGMMRESGMASMPMVATPVMSGRTEGRIAFLKTELKITDAQLPLWNAVADAIRADAKSGTGMIDGMGKSGTLSDRLAARDKMLTAQAEAVRKFKSAVDPLYAALTDEQKKTADELLLSPMGMM